MKPDGWQAKRRIEHEYDRSMRRLWERMWQIIGANEPEMMNPWDLVRRLRRIAGTGRFGQLAVAVAHRMVTHTFTDTARTWRHAARTGSNGRLIYEALRNEMQTSTGATVNSLVERNATIIRSMPGDIASRVTHYIQQETLKGKRHEQIAKEILEKFPGTTASRASLIARTEASKAHTALIQSRAARLGIGWYVWRTCKDSRVRSSHDHMEGVLCRFDTPPAPELLANEGNAGTYNAGEIYNCRCYPAPLIDADDVSWPRKVHYGGRIVVMSKAQFKQIAA